METVNLQSVVKAVAPKTPSVAISPMDVTGSKVRSNTEVAGNMLPLETDSSQLPSKAEGKVAEAVAELKSFVQNIQRGVQFSVHEETGRSVIIITDKETGEEIRQFPSDEALTIAARISETLAVPGERGIGLLVNGKA